MGNISFVENNNSIDYLIEKYNDRQIAVFDCTGEYQDLFKYSNVEYIHNCDDVDIYNYLSTIGADCIIICNISSTYTDDTWIENIISKSQLFLY